MFLPLPTCFIVGILITLRTFSLLSDLFPSALSSAFPCSRDARFMSPVLNQEGCSLPSAALVLLPLK